MNAAGACGYGPLALKFYGGHVAAAGDTLFKSGEGCGGCFQVLCMSLLVLLWIHQSLLSHYLCITCLPLFLINCLCLIYHWIDMVISSIALIATGAKQRQKIAHLPHTYNIHIYPRANTISPNPPPLHHLVNLHS